MKDFTVISICTDTGQIFSDHVQAENYYDAFAVAAKQKSESGLDIDFVASMAGLLNEGENIQFAGSGTVDLQTVLEQTDVFS